jgi:hypothetical protein
MNGFFSTRIQAGIAVILAASWMAPGLYAREAVEPQIIPFSTERWELANAKVVDYLERQALTGTAFLKDAEFEDGVIECDIVMKAGARSYPGFLFRVQSQEDYERVYLRPHRSPLYDDAIQYIPAFHGVDSWQIYNGPGITSRAVIPTDRWVHVKVEVLGTQARLFLDNAAQAALVIGDLKRGKSKGGLGLTAMADGSSYFSNFSFRPTNDLSFPPAPLIHMPPGCVLEWELSQPMKRRSLNFDSYPDLKAPGVAPWTKVSAQ